MYETTFRIKQYSNKQSSEACCGFVVMLSVHILYNCVSAFRVVGRASHIIVPYIDTNVRSHSNLAIVIAQQAPIRTKTTTVGLRITSSRVSRSCRNPKLLFIFFYYAPFARKSELPVSARSVALFLLLLGVL